MYFCVIKEGMMIDKNIIEAKIAKTIIGVIFGQEYVNVVQEIINCKKLEEKDYFDKINEIIEQLSIKYNLQFDNIKVYLYLYHTHKYSTGHKSTPDIIKSNINIPLELINKTGVVYLDNRLNNEEISIIVYTNYKENSILGFPITKQNKTRGKVIMELSQNKEDIPLISAYKNIEENADQEVVTKIIGQSGDRRKLVLKNYLILPFYVYRFCSAFDKEYILLSENKLKLDDYIIEGQIIPINDKLKIGQKTEIQMRKDILIVHTSKLSAEPFPTAKDMIKFVIDKELDKHYFNYLFSIKANNNRQLFRQPEWFCWFVSSLLFASKKGNLPNFPAHLMMIAKEGTGKTTLLECISEKYNETDGIIDASSSTLKQFVPSFATNPAKIGSLAKANRICVIDEFFRALIRNTTNTDRREESMGTMNSLLEHRNRTIGSGTGADLKDFSMSARVFSVTNPVYETGNMEQLCTKFDKTWISRWVVYYQNEPHINFIQSQKKNNEYINYDLDKNDFLRIIDTMNGISAQYDVEKIDAIYKSMASNLSEDLLSVYNARYDHHINCIIDGVVKTRCLLEKSDEFIAKEEDYEIVKLIWQNIIFSWMPNKDSIKMLPIEERESHIPSDAHHIFDILNANTGQIEYEKLKKDIAEFMHGNRFISLFWLLKDWGLIIEKEGVITKYNYIEVEYVG